MTDEHTVPGGYEPDETQIAVLTGVREHVERLPVELWWRNGRLVVRAYNECGNNYTDIDWGDLLAWAATGSAPVGDENGKGITLTSVAKRD
jgi:hypothetical protein